MGGLEDGAVMEEKEHKNLGREMDTRGNFSGRRISRCG